MRDHVRADGDGKPDAPPDAREAAAREECDREETIEANPKSWAAWKRRAEHLEALWEEQRNQLTAIFAALEPVSTLNESATATIRRLQADKAALQKFFDYNPSLRHAEFQTLTTERDALRKEVEEIAEILSDAGMSVDSDEPHCKQWPDYVRDILKQRDEARARELATLEELQQFKTAHDALNELLAKAEAALTAAQQAAREDGE
jgi:hypothetical protein